MLSYTEGQDVIVDEKGATIGRSDASTLVLEDKEKLVSRRHAIVAFENGQYNLTDSSLAGTFIDGAIEPINNATVQLADGMQFRIGEYIIVCHIRNEVSPVLYPEADPFLNSTEEVLESKNSIQGSPFADGLIHDQNENNALLDAVESDFNSPFMGAVEPANKAGLLDVSEDNSLLDLVSPEFNAVSPFADNSLLDSAADKASLADRGIMAENISSLNDNYIPAEPDKNATALEHEEMPEDFNFEDLFNLEEEESDKTSVLQRVVVDDSKSINPAQKSQDTQAYLATENIQSASGIGKVATIQKPVIESNQLLQAFLQGAQINHKEIDFKHPDEKMTRIGVMFRQFVESTVAVLRSRAEFKSLFRVTVTTIKQSDNNPLKFAATTDEALKHLINDGQGGFKKSVESIDEGFNDLLNHQLAMQAGIQASLADILRHFDPAIIEKQYKAGIVLQKKSKCWVKYTQVYEHLSESAVDDFFGDAFSDAYEKQMKQLKR
jgi:type VI secretion system FHA domain protein